MESDPIGPMESDPIGLYADTMIEPDLSRSPQRPSFWRLHWLGVLLATGLALFLGVTLYLWLVLLSPLGYQAPENLPAIDPGREHRVFVFGTLRIPLVRWIVTGDRLEPKPAVLPGYRKESLSIVPDVDSNVEGLVFKVTPEQLRRLDRYERLGLRYERILLALKNGRCAWVYRRLPE